MFRLKLYIIGDILACR